MKPDIVTDDDDALPGHNAGTSPPAGIRWIMLAVLAWGLLLALGTYLFGGNQPLLRAAIVVGCTLGFLGLWWAALAIRGRTP